MKKKIYIAIDSPAAAGAGTQAKLIAKHYNLFYLDTGKIYRFIGYQKIKNNKKFNLNFIKELLKENSYSNFDGDSRVYQTSIAAKLWMCFNLECFFLDQDENK